VGAALSADVDAPTERPDFASAPASRQCCRVFCRTSKNITDLCAKLLSNHASLPSLPAVAARIHDAMAGSNWSMRTIASIIKSERTIS
jgi:hypothetical protein